MNVHTRVYDLSFCSPPDNLQTFLTMNKRWSPCWRFVQLLQLQILSAPPPPLQTLCADRPGRVCGFMQHKWDRVFFLLSSLSWRRHCFWTLLTVVLLIPQGHVSPAPGYPEALCFLAWLFSHSWSGRTGIWSSIPYVYICFTSNVGHFKQYRCIHVDTVLDVGDLNYLE